VLVFECKNWANPVGSAEVGFFRMKIEERHLDVGILIAANGITGNAEMRRAAHNIIDTAFISAARTHLIVITRNELLGLASTQDFIKLLQDKISKIVMRLSQF
jgi:cell division GTPase FtsZ